MAIFKKIRLFFWIIGGLVGKYKKIIILGITFGFLGFLIIRKVSPLISLPKRVERIAVVGKYKEKDLPPEILSYLSFGLIKIAEDDAILPALAEKWKVEEEGKFYTFFLKNFFWHDGKSLSSEDLKFEIADVEVLYPHKNTIQFRLKETFAPFPTLLVKPIFKNDLIGLGNYKVSAIKKNRGFIEEIFVEDSEKKIIFKFYPTFTAAKIGFLLGEVDRLENLLENPFPQGWENFLAINCKEKFDQFIGLFFNTEDEKLSEKKLRQALAYAFEKPEDRERAIGPIAPNSWAFNPQVKKYEKDAKKSQEIFKDLEIKNLSLKISTTEPFLKIAEEIKKSWEETLPIKVEIELINAIPSDFQVLLIAQRIPADPDQYPLWHSTQEGNITRFKSPKIDKLLEDGRRTIKQEDRKEKYLEFQRFLIEDVPVVFISYPKNCTISRSRIRFLNLLSTR